jgi:hypothetical protein
VCVEVRAGKKYRHTDSIATGRRRFRRALKAVSLAAPRNIRSPLRRPLIGPEDQLLSRAVYARMRE